MQKKVNVAIAGATGVVGQTFLKVLAERKFPVGSLKLLASERSQGRSLSFNGARYPVETLSKDSFAGVDIALFSPGAERSKKFAPLAVKAGAIVIDNSSAFRYEVHVPLVVPEVNADEINRHQGIIANPNCSTIQLVTVLGPIHKAAGLKRVVVSTYQSVSGAGAKALEKLFTDSARFLKEIKSAARVLECAGRPTGKTARPASVAFNCVPHIDVFEDNGYSREEMKIVRETRKILGIPDLAITATAVRVPVFIGHAECVNVETEKRLTPLEARKFLARAPGVCVVDDPQQARYPLPAECAGRDEVFVGRIRQDESVPNGLNLWIVSDNLRKGAALNAVQIAEYLIRAYQ